VGTGQTALDLSSVRVRTNSTLQLYLIFSIFQVALINNEEGTVDIPVGVGAYQGVNGKKRFFRPLF
jgi:hypothetical protein